jgi:hypothetical protein
LRGGAGGGGASAELADYPTEHSSEVLHNLFIADPKDLVSASLEPFVPLNIAQRDMIETVYSSIDFYYQPRRMAYEINDVVSERRLFPKMNAIVFQRPQSFPELGFRVGKIFS